MSRLLFAILLIVVPVIGVALAQPAAATSPQSLYSPINSTVAVLVSLDGSVIGFPASPDRIVLGRKDAFSVETIGSDLAIAPLVPNATSSLFVYVMGRRYAFRLKSAAVPSTVLLVTDEPVPNQPTKPRSK